MGSCVSASSKENNWVYKDDRKVYVNGKVASEIYHTTNVNPLKNDTNIYLSKGPKLTTHLPKEKVE